MSAQQVMEWYARDAVYEKTALSFCNKLVQSLSGLGLPPFRKVIIEFFFLCSNRCEKLLHIGQYHTDQSGKSGIEMC